MKKVVIGLLLCLAALNVSGQTTASDEVESVKGRPLLFYTDGLSEAENSEQLLFGDDRILDVMASQPFGGVRQLVECMSEGVRQFVGDAPQSDDLAMLCIMCH
jgi:serine phosphatase RsbU (regulator of sigma subunit)